MPLRAARPHRLGAQKPLPAASPHRFKAAVFKSRCKLPACTALKQPVLGSRSGGQKPLRAARPHSQHRLEAAVVLKGCCGLPARTAWKQLWCSSRCGLPARTAWKQLWCSRPLHAPLGSSSAAQRRMRAASLHRLEAALVLGSSFGAQRGCQPTKRPAEEAQYFMGTMLLAGQGRCCAGRESQTSIYCPLRDSGTKKLYLMVSHIAGVGSETAFTDEGFEIGSTRRAKISK